MPEFIPTSTWDAYKDIINRFHADANQEQVIWRRMISDIDRWGEDESKTTTDIILQGGLVQYNYFRSWPITKTGITGEIDKESILVYFNKNYLSEQGYINSGGNFIFRPGEDRFIVDGIEYKPMGDSSAAQAGDEALLIFIILKREETATGNRVYPDDTP